MGLAGGPDPFNCGLRQRRRNHHHRRRGEPRTTAAAGTTTTASSEEGLPLIDPLEVTGDIVTAGSSTVFPLTEAVAAQFEDDGYGGQITIDSVGTGAGFERFCEAGETDISNASRPIDEEEIALCEAIGRTPIEFRVGTDALAIVVSPNNYFVEDLTLEQLALAFSTASTWADVDPAFPGPSDRSLLARDRLRDLRLLRRGRLRGRSRNRSWRQAICSCPRTTTCWSRESKATPAPRATPRRSCAIGYFGFAYYSENAAGLTLVSVDGVEASGDNVGNGTYPLARPLFIYSDATIMAEKPQVASFIAYYLDVVNDVITEVGYFPAPEADLQAAIDAWLAATGM